MSYQSFRHVVLPAVMVAALSACGGSSSAPAPALQVSGQTLSLTVATSSASAQLANPLTFSVAQPAASVSYYYKLTFKGTAITQVIADGQSGTVAHKGNPALASGNALGYNVGADVSGAMPASGSSSIGQVSFVPPAELGAGAYQDTLTVSVCTDAHCTQPIANSPQTIAVTYTVTGQAQPAAALSVTPSVRSQTTTTASGPAPVSVAISALGLPPTGAYVSWTDGSGALVSGGSFNSALGASGTGPVTGTISLTLVPPASAGVGAFTDTLSVRICFDAACTRPVSGSPFTVAINYTVGSYTQTTLPLPVSGLAWSAKTSRLYAVVQSGSAQYPNTLVQIEPVAGTAESAVQLAGATDTLASLSISDDGEYLYVAVYDSSGANPAIDRIRTADLGLDLQILLPANGYVLRAPVPAPAQPHALAVMYVGASGASGLLIYDDSTPRGPSLLGSAAGCSAVGWSSDASTAYLSCGAVPHQFPVLAFVSTAPPPMVTNSVTSTFEGNIHQVNGLLLGDDGQVFDPVTLAFESSFLGPATLANEEGAAAFDPGLNRAYFLTNDQLSDNVPDPPPPLTLRTFDLTTRKLLGTAQFPFSGGAAYLTRWGTNGLAFLSADPASGKTILVLVAGAQLTQ